jgi:hypothetical protein
MLTADKVVLTASSINLTLSGVVLDGTESLYTEDCQDPDVCSFCPYFKPIGKGYVMDDAGVTYAASDVTYANGCNDYNSLNFIAVSNNGSLTMNNVKVSNFRQQFNSVILSESGAVTLQNTDFDNVQAGRNPVITVNCKSTPNSGCVFSYTSGTITRLNNGYEYRSDLVQIGFLSITNCYSVVLSSLTFRKNAVFNGTTAPYLIYINKTTMTSTLTSLTFDTNVVTATLMAFDYTELAYEMHDLDSQGYSIQTTQTHLAITDLILTHNSCSNAILVTEGTQNINAKIQISEGSSTNVMTTSAISLSCTAEMQESDYSYSTVTFLDQTSNKVTAKTKPYTVEISAVLSKTLAGTALIYAKDIPILKLSDCEFASVNIEDEYSALTTNSVVIKAFQEDFDIYLKKDVPNKTVKCFNVVYAKALYSLDVVDSSWSDFYCASGNNGIYIDSIQGPVTFTSLTFTSLETGIGTGSTIRGSNNLSSLTVTSCTFSSLKSSPIYLQAQNSLSVVSSTFENIQSYETVGLYVTANQAVSLQNLTFRSMSSIMAYVIVIAPYEERLDITMNDLSFTNISTSASLSCIYISGLTSNLSWARLTFDGIKGANTLMSFTSDTGLATTSSITEITARNIEDTGSMIQVNLSAGQLTIQDSNFSANTAASIIKTVLTNSASVVIKNCTFKSQKGTQVLNFSESSYASMVTTQGCTISDNTAKAALITSAKWTDSGSTIQNNSKGGVFANSGYINLTGTKFLSNKNPEDGGAVQLTYKCTFLCSSCTFTDNSAITGGAIRLDQSSVMTLTKSTFANNSSLSGGSALYIISSIKENSMTECSITNNTSQGAGTVTLIESKLTISKTSFAKNVVASSGAGLQLNSSVLTCTQCAFADQTATYGSFALISTSSTAYFVSSTFNNGQSTLAGGGFSCSDSVLKLEGCTGSTVSTKGRGGLIYMTGQR